MRIDPRGAKALRVSVALIVLADLAQRAPAIEALYTDAGVLPRSALPFHAQLPSLYWWASTTAQVELLFAVTAAFAVLMLLGWHARLTTFCAWVLVLSLQNRNPAACHAGDSVLCLLLFWMIFLPESAAGLVLQFALIFFCAVDFKLMGHSWLSGYAARETLSNSLYARPLAHSLLAYPWLLRQLSWLTIAGEALVAIAVLCPWRQPLFRGLAVIAAIATQLSFGLFLTLGIFPWIVSAFALSLAPGEFWDRVWPAAPEPTPRPHRLPSFATAIAVPLVLLWNLGEAGATYGDGVPLNQGWPGRAASLLGLRQRWSMFAPEVETEDGQFAVLATGAQGTRDVLPLMVGAPLHESQRWTLMFLELLQAHSPALLHGLGRYGCSVANRDLAADSVTILYVHFDHLADGSSTPLEFSELVREPCRVGGLAARVPQ